MPRTSEPWDRRALAFLVSLLVLAGASLPWLVHPWYEADWSTYDASMYLLCAKSLLSGQGYSALGIPFTGRPPGFSVLLMPLLAWRGLDFLLLNSYVSLFGLAGIGLLFAFARQRLGNLLAGCVAVAIWLNPGYRHFSNQVMSDVPGTALLLACLLIERWASRSDSARREAVLGVAVGLSGLVRSMDLILLPAMIAMRLLGRLRNCEPGTTWRGFFARRVLVPCVACALVLAPWSVRNAVNGPSIPDDQTLFASYWTALWHVDGADPSSATVGAARVLARVPVRAREVLGALGSRLQPALYDPGQLILGGLMVAALAAVLWRRREAAEACALLFFGVLLVTIYFASDVRLALPVYVLGVCAAVDLVLAIGERRLGGRIARVSLSALVLSCATFDFAPRRGWKEIEAAFQERLRVAAECQKLLTPDVRLAAPIGRHWSLFLDRPVFSLYFTALRRHSMQGVEEAIDRRRIQVVLVGHESPQDEKFGTWLTEHYPRHLTVGPCLLFRVRD